MCPDFAALKRPFGHPPGGHLQEAPRQRSHVGGSRCRERLAEAGIESSVGSMGDRYNNTLAETITGLNRAKVTYRRAL